MSSPARANEAPAQPVCNGALCPVWSVSTADQASMIWMAFRAYRSSRVTYQISAWVYAAMPSARSSVHPWLGLDEGPHSTTARGFGVQESDAYGLARIAS